MPRETSGRSPSNVLNFLNGIDFPCYKEQLVEYAEEREAPDEIVDLLEDLPDQEFQSMSEVMSAIGQVK